MGDGPADPTLGRPTTAWVLAGAGALCLGLLAGAAAVLVPGGSPAAEERAARRQAAPPECTPVQAARAADVDGDGCDEAVDWLAADAELAYTGADGELLRFRVGRPGDELVLGDWDCDGTATAAVIRAGTGETYLFDAWAAAGETLVAEPGPMVPAAATATVVDEGGCDRLEGKRS